MISKGWVSPRTIVNASEGAEGPFFRGRKEAADRKFADENASGEFRRGSRRGRVLKKLDKFAPCSSFSGVTTRSIPSPLAHKNRRINPNITVRSLVTPPHHRLDSSINSNLFPPSYFRSYAATKKQTKKRSKTPSFDLASPSSFVSHLFISNWSLRRRFLPLPLFSA